VRAHGVDEEISDLFNPEVDDTFAQILHVDILQSVAKNNSK
jgi:hypothetical protein